MTNADIIDLVEAKYTPIADDLKLAWAKKSKVIHVKKGDILVHEGSRSSDLWFVAKGVIRARYTNEGKQICDWFAFENDFMFAISSFYQDAPSMHQIDMLSDGILLQTSRSDIESMCDAHHVFERIGRLSATEAMIRLQEKIVSIQFETAHKKLENLLKARPNIYQLVPLGDIASYLGMTQETLSRIRAEQVRI